MSDDYSVGALAQIVTSAAVFPKPAAEEDVELVLRRLRSWTVQGALLAMDEPYPGTGKHRRYDRSALYCASVLNALAINEQPIGVLVGVGRLIRNLAGSSPLFAGAIVDRWNQAVEQSGQIFLVRSAGLRMYRDDSGTAGPTDFAVETLVPAHELPETLNRHGGGVFVNLTFVFARLPR